VIANNTPLEIYNIRGRRIFVKREDLCVVPPSPALAKLRGIRNRLIALKEAGVTKVGVMDTKVSKAGWGVAAMSIDLGIEVYAFYPHLKEYGSEAPENQFRAHALGAKLMPLKGGRTGVLYAQAKKQIESMGGYMIPMGLVVIESVDAIAREAQTLPEQVLGGDIVLSVGSGMSLAGIQRGLGKRVHKIYGISAGMDTKRQENRIIKETGRGQEENVELILPEGVDYYDREEIETPFPSSPYYDKKAWKWLVDNLDQLKDPVIFWNIGV